MNSSLQKGVGARLFSSLRKFGPGGRESDTGIRACVFGATGFLGRYVVAMLGAQGISVNIPHRGDYQEMAHLKLTGDLGRVSGYPYCPRNEDSVRRAIDGCDVVINLIGKDFDTHHVLPWWVNYTNEDQHARIPRMIAEISQEMGVHQFIHVSALAASKDSPSEWARTKAVGEDAVRKSFPGATIIRPADIFGDEDRFLNKYATMARALPYFIMTNDGNSLKQPVHSNDVAAAIVKTIQNTDSINQTYDLAGPSVMSTKEVVEFVFQQIRRPPVVVDLPPLFLQGLAFAMEMGPNPTMTRDKIKLDSADIILRSDSGNATFEDLGIEPSGMENISIRFLHQYRMGGHFLETS